MKQFLQKMIPGMNRLTPHLVIGLISVFYLIGIRSVPFHPDEATHIYMSRDVELFLSSPLDLAWNSDTPVTPAMRYRLIDAPMTRYLVGLGRLVFNLSPLSADWDWSSSWSENQQNGAMPSDQLLWVARASNAILFPFTLYLMYQSGTLLAGSLGGWLAIALSAGNALLLLHTRRAMSESALFFFTCYIIYASLKWERRKWLLGFLLALAVSSKHSAIAMLPLIISAILVDNSMNKQTWRNKLLQLLGTGMAFLAAFAFLNPVFWQHPVKALLTSSSFRTDLSTRQVQEIGLIAPQLTLVNPGERIVAAIAQSFYAPPAISDVGNYINAQQESTIRYLSNPIHNIGRDWISGSIGLIFLISGLAMAMRSPWANTPRLWHILFLLISFLGCLLFYLIFIPLAFQRYVILLFPSGILLIDYAIVTLVARLHSRSTKKPGAIPTNRTG